ncbi:MAG: hypothetical protein KDA49_18790 [Rhodospirillaceae bacterium]|nr:hypothetical protein [Rhodospirillaceae bacterium]
MSDGLAKDLCARLDVLEAERAPRNAELEEIAELMRPLRSGFFSATPKGKRRFEMIVDGTARMAALNLASGLWGMMTNAGTAWSAWGHEDPKVLSKPEVAEFCELATMSDRSSFNGDGGGFYARSFELIWEWSTMGTGVFFVGAPPTGKIQFATCPLLQCYIAQDHWGLVDTVYRKFRLTARQAVQKWGGECPAKVAGEANKNPDRSFTFLHATEPRLDAKPYDAADNRTWPVASRYVWIDDKVLIRDAGYPEFPYQVPRWATAPGDPYGFGCGHFGLADTKMLQAQGRTVLVGAQRAIAPPVLAAEGVFGPEGIRTGPESIIEGAIDPVTGKRLVDTLDARGDVGIGVEMIAQTRGQVREAFLWSLMRMVNDRTMTATEVLERAEEQLKIAGPHLERGTHEWLEPMQKRVFSIKLNRGRYGDLPDAIRQDGRLAIQFNSPLARAQSLEEARKILRSCEASAQVANSTGDKSGLDVLDAGEITRRVWLALDSPATLLRRPKEVRAIRRAREQAMAAEQAATAAPGLGAAVRDLAIAGQMGAAPRKAANGQ